MSLKIETIATIVQLMSAVPREDRSCQTPQHKEKEKKTDSIKGKKRTIIFFLSRPGCKGKAKFATRFSGCPESFQISFLRML